MKLQGYGYQCEAAKVDDPEHLVETISESWHGSDAHQTEARIPLHVFSSFI